MRDNASHAAARESGNRCEGAFAMVISYLVQARDCYAVDPQQIEAAGGHFLGISPVEDDGTVIVDVESPADDRDANVRLSEIFAKHFHN